MGSDLAPYIESVVREVRGEPNRALSNKRELRFGTNGSLSVDLVKGTWYDHESEMGGGVLDFLERERGFTSAEAFEYLRSIGYEQGDRRLKNGNGHAMPLRLVRTFDYCDEAGAVVYQVCRFEPKTFRQRQPDGQGGWRWSKDGVRRVPYRLPELLEAISLDHRILIVEGEKDVDSLRAWGVTASTNDQGAGKWTDDLAQFFEGARVIVVPDNDAVGRKHMNEVGRSLSGVCEEVGWLELPGLPDKEDISWWIDNGGSPERLLSLMDMARPWTPMEETATVKFRLVPFGQVRPSTKPRYLVYRLIPDKGVVLLWGAPKTGKSFWIFDLSMHVALGRKYRGLHVEQGDVVYIALEGQENFHDRIEAFRQANMQDYNGDENFFFLPVALDLIHEHERLAADLKVQMPGRSPRLIVIDTVNRSLRGSESSDKDMSAYVRAAGSLVDAFGCSVVLVHHSGYDSTHARGHTSLVGAVDAEIEIATDLYENVIARVRRAKGGPSGVEIASKMERVVIGMDDYGHDIDTYVVRELNAQRSREPLGARLNDNRVKFFKCLIRAMEEFGQPAPDGVPLNVRHVVDYMRVKELFRDQELNREEDLEKERGRLKALLRRSVDALLVAGVIGAQSPWIWPTGRPVYGPGFSWKPLQTEIVTAEEVERLREEA